MDALRPRDEVKFVIRDRADYEYAATRGVGTQADVACGRRVVLAGPRRLAPAELAAWILADKLPVRLQLQAHKYIWGADKRGV